MYYQPFELVTGKSMRIVLLVQNDILAVYYNDRFGAVHIVKDVMTYKIRETILHLISFKCHFPPKMSKLYLRNT